MEEKLINDLFCDCPLLNNQYWINKVNKNEKPSIIFIPIKNVKNNSLPGEIAFKLYDTYGFPLDLTQDILKNKKINVDIAGFDKAMNEIPSYIEFDSQKMTGKFTRIPVLSDVPFPVQMEPNLVVEYYSR